MAESQDHRYSGSIRERIRTVFDKSADQDRAQDYLDRLAENLREVAKSLGRTAFLILILVAAFELIVRAAIAKVSFGPFEIEDLSLIRIALPVIVAFLLYQLVHELALAVDIESAYHELYRMLHRDLYDSRLVLLVSPRIPIAFGPELPARSGKIYEFARSTIGSVIDTSIFTAALLFQAYAYYTQFRDLPSQSLLIWIALAVSATLVLYSTVVLYSDAS